MPAFLASSSSAHSGEATMVAPCMHGAHARYPLSISRRQTARLPSVPSVPHGSPDARAQRPCTLHASAGQARPAPARLRVHERGHVKMRCRKALNRSAYWSGGTAEGAEKDMRLSSHSAAFLALKGVKMSMMPAGRVGPRRGGQGTGWGPGGVTRRRAAVARGIAGMHEPRKPPAIKGTRHSGQQVRPAHRQGMPVEQRRLQKLRLHCHQRGPNALLRP